MSDRGIWPASMREAAISRAELRRIDDEREAYRRELDRQFMRAIQRGLLAFFAVVALWVISGEAGDWFWSNASGGRMGH